MTAAMAVSTSTVAPSISRSRVNCRVMLVEPWLLDEIMESRPAMVVNCRSMRGGDGGSHGLRISAGEAGGDGEGGVIDRGEIADGQRAVGNDAEERNGQHQEAGGDGAADEGFGNIHWSAGFTELDSTWGCGDAEEHKNCRSGGLCGSAANKGFMGALTGGLAAAFTGALAVTAARASYQYFTAGGQAQLAFGDYGLAGVQTVIDHHILIHPGAGYDGAVFHGAVLFHDVDERSVLAGLDGFIGNHHGVQLGGEAERDADELAGPELVVGIGKGAFELDGAGGDVDRVVDEG